MLIVQDAALPRGKRARANQNESPDSKPSEDATDSADSLTFVTTEGEHITFSDMTMPVGDAAAIAGEEALGKIWNRQAEDQAWHGM